MSKTVTLQQIGSEYVLQIPTELIESLGLQAGVKLEVHRSGQRSLMIKPAKNDKELEEILAIHEELMGEYHNAFQKLAE